jgi:signal transduction histidine kinase
MPKILISDQVYEEQLYAELEARGVEYEKVDRENFIDELITGDYTAVIGNGDEQFYSATTDYDPELPIIDYDDSLLATSYLSGNPEADASSIEQLSARYEERSSTEETIDFATSVLSHDTRNTLNVVSGHIEIAKETVEEGAEEHLEVAERAADSLNDIIASTEEILDENEAEQLDLTDMLQNVYHNYVSEAEQRGFELELDIEPRLTAEAGPEISNMYGQLIRNSFEHSGGDRIRLGAKENGNNVKVVYEDNGTGIPDELKDTVIERGFSQKNGAKGGLGMFLLSEHSDRYGIELEVEDSEDLGGVKITTLLEQGE